ncbi:DUF808 domain-containing protein [soil metagenome]
MAGASLLTLLDDIASVLDDVAVMTKVAAKKTAGVLGDDLALNAEQVNGIAAHRELPVVWAVAVGSLKNKVILVPLALSLNALAPWAITPLLMAGGAYLCYEGFEKLAHKYLHNTTQAAREKAEHIKLVEALSHTDVDMVAFEKDKIKGAIRTDFVLSAEIIIITLGTVAEAAFTSQVVVLSGIALIMTIGVYGFVAGIVKLDDIGFYLKRQKSRGIWRTMQHATGDVFLAFAPKLMKSLTIVGTIAMFMVGGGILTHGFHDAQLMIENAALNMSKITTVGGILGAITPSLLNAVAGIIAGAVTLVGVNVCERLYRKIKP